MRNSVLRSDKYPFVVTVSVMLIVAAVAWIGGSGLQNATRDQVGDQVVTVLDISHRGLVAWAEGQRRVAVSWADSPEVASLTQALLETDLTRSALLSASSQTGLRDHLALVLVAQSHLGYFVVARDGLTLSSTRDENVGTPNLALAQAGFFEDIWEGASTLTTPLPSDVPLPDDNGVLQADQPTMFVGAPIRDSSGEIVAALTFRIDPTQDFTAILQRGRVGESGETYAFDVEGRLISESRFDDQLRSIGLIGVDQRAILNVSIRDPGVNLVIGEDGALPVHERPLTRMASAALASGEGRDLDGYRDYRGVEVVGAWLWDEQLDLGITSEIDVAEAYGVLRSNRLLMIGAAVFIELLIVGMAVLFIRRRQGLVESRERLRDLNTQLAVQVEKLKQAEADRRSYLFKLERSNQELEEFASIAAHDLQEPLRKVETFADRLVAISADDLDERGRDYLERLEGSVKRMRRLIDDLLSYSRVGTGGKEFEVVDLGTVAAEVVSDLRTLIEETRGEVSIEDLPVIEADPVQMSQLLQNLIGNALKFHRPEVPPLVTVEGWIVDGHRIGGVQTCMLTVRDNGIGFEKKYLDRIFSMFQRLHGRSEYPGTGVGLAVCRKIVQRHDGEITATSTVAEGSTFIVSLPVNHDVRADDSLRTEVIRTLSPSN